mmetsp:Transcript_11318/g.35195  ORF Transcript_11318/g.35195 Transcript_11318/m.35195 type:complete len:279 (+) Transcript_11318:1095-1931(+)
MPPALPVASSVLSWLAEASASTCSSEALARSAPCTRFMCAKRRSRNSSCRFASSRSPCRSARRTRTTETSLIAAARRLTSVRVAADSRTTGMRAATPASPTGCPAHDSVWRSKRPTVMGSVSAMAGHGLTPTVEQDARYTSRALGSWESGFGTHLNSRSEKSCSRPPKPANVLFCSRQLVACVAVAIGTRTSECSRLYMLRDSVRSRRNAVASITDRLAWLSSFCADCGSALATSPSAVNSSVITPSRWVVGRRTRVRRSCTPAPPARCKRSFAACLD